MARSPSEEQRNRRRKRLIQGLVLGGAAVGVPALINLAVARRARDVPDASWGSRDTYRFDSGRNRGEVAYQRLGGGDPILLLHAFGAGHSSAEWRRVAESLASSYDVYAPDLPGWGHSDACEGPLDPSFYVEWLKGFCVEVIGRPAVIVAAGLPAAYALHLASREPSAAREPGAAREASASGESNAARESSTAREPKLVRALGLVVPQGLEGHGREPETRDVLIHRMLRSPVLGTSALNVFTSRSAIANYLRREVYAAGDLVDDALVDLHYTNSHRPGCQRALAAYVSGFLNHSVKNLLERVQQPLWIAWGRKATGPAVESADLWLLRLRQAELEIFEQAGVLPHAESPEEFSRKLERFLLDLPPHDPQALDPSSFDSNREGEEADGPAASDSTTT
ncbi:MAG: alpha/beta hydrolase [Acidobacteriota bacterium]